jgi:hypothetical protein
VLGPALLLSKGDALAGLGTQNTLPAGGFRRGGSPACCFAAVELGADLRDFLVYSLFFDLISYQGHLQYGGVLGGSSSCHEYSLRYYNIGSELRITLSYRLP